MKKIVSLTLVMLLVLSLVTGCGASSTMKNAVVSPAAPREEMAMDSAAGAVMMATNTSGTKGEVGQSVPNTEQKLIKTIRMDAETENLDALLPQVMTQIDALGGYVENQELYNGSSYNSYRSRSASLTIRIPAEQLNGFVENVKGVSNVVSYNESTENVTLRYVSTESRMKALQTEEARLLEFMEQAETMADLLEIEARLTDVRYELENVTSQLRLYDNQVDYATIYLNIEEVQEYTPVEEPTFWERITEGFSDSLDGLKDGAVDFVVWIIANSPYLVVYGVILAGAVLLARRVRKFRIPRKQKKQDEEQK